MTNIKMRIHRRDDVEMKRLGEECQRLRESAGLPLAAIAERKGVSINSVRRWLGKAKPILEDR